MMPLLYIDGDQIREKISRDMRSLVETFTRGNPDAPRMKPLDATKVLMGIRSERDCVKQFMHDGKYFAAYHEYDYEQLSSLSDQVVKQWYLDNIHVLEETLKRKKV